MIVNSTAFLPICNDFLIDGTTSMYQLYTSHDIHNDVCPFVLISMQLICSNHGRCLCTECYCDVDFAGEFCNISTVSIHTRVVLFT